MEKPRYELWGEEFALFGVTGWDVGKKLNAMVELGRECPVEKVVQEALALGATEDDG